MLQPVLNQHDPGGQRMIRLPDELRSSAEFSDGRIFRQKLMRDWTAEGQQTRTILWLGMNPSTADLNFNDPSCHREFLFSRQWGYTRYLKGNILDYRATHPRDIPRDLGAARTQRNLEAIREMAAEAESVVIAHGNMLKRHQPAIDDVLGVVAQSGAPLFCLGLTGKGFPRHVLPVPANVQLQQLG